MAQAGTADKYALYQRTVQAPATNVAMIATVYQRLRRRSARRLREDFCGTGATACAWVRRQAGNSAVGLDIDREVLAWGRRHNLAALPSHARRRVRLLRCDVLRGGPARWRADVIAALNNSWAVFTERGLLLRYFRGVRRSLARDGVFVMDLFGGRDYCKPMRRRARRGGVVYVWEQSGFNAITSVMDYAIHYRFEDGSWLRRAFEYRWRVWGLTEVCDLLAEAGFADTAVMWPVTDRRGRPTGRYSATRLAPGGRSWDVLIVAIR